MKSRSMVIAAIALLSLSAAGAESQEKLSSKYGADDQAGASNLITPEKIKQASGLIKQGKVYPLARTYEAKMPMFGQRVFALRGTGAVGGGPVGENGTIWNDDFLSRSPKVLQHFSEPEVFGGHARLATCLLRRQRQHPGCGIGG
jgi:hypothetical protein